MEENNTTNEATKSLSEQEVWSVVNFAQSLYNTLNFGVYTPFTQQQQLVELNNDQLIPTYNNILKSLKQNPMEAKTLSRYSEFMEVYDTIYGKTIRYYASLLAFDLHITCKNIKNPRKEYKSEEYKKDLRRVYKFLDAFDYKQEFKKILKEVLRKEIVYVYFRDSHSINEPIDVDSDDIDTNSKVKKDEVFALQIMPQKYCMLDGYFNNSQLTYSFDMSYFLKGTVDIDLFSPELKKKFLEVFKSDNGDSYVPSNQLKKRKGKFATWVQLSPLDGAYAFKLDISNFRQTPIFASLMKSTFNNDVIEKLQFDKDMISAYALLTGEMKTFDNAKSGTQSNQFVVSPQVLGQLLQLIQNSFVKNIKPVSLPLENHKLSQFVDNSPLMAQYQLQNSSSQGASASPLIYNTGNLAQFAMEQAVETDYQVVAPLYEQFNNFLNFFINKKTVKYKFNFEFSGLDRQFYKKNQQKALNELLTVGLVPNTSYIASVYGIKPQSFDRMLEEAKYGDIQDKLSMLYNKNTMSGVSVNQNTNQNRGRPNETDVNNLTDNGAVSREYK